MSSFSYNSDSKILKAVIQQKQNSKLKGEIKFPDYDLKHSTGISIVAKGETADRKNTIFGSIVSAWGVFSVLAVLGNAIRRVLPIAIQPFKQKDLTPLHSLAYVLWSIYMAYTEGHKAFHLKFSPFIVRRALDLKEKFSILRFIFAGPYCMGLFGATKKRMTVSWAISLGVTGLVFLVKKLPYPWRSIIDGGVVVGLTYGSISIAWFYLRSFWGIIPNVDPCYDDKDIQKNIKSK